jgi:hypothetical protein
MMTFEEIIGCDEKYRLIPLIDRDEIHLLWHSDFWDGPRSGMLLYRGDEFWFEVIAESADDVIGWYRRFAVIKLSMEQHAEEWRWHRLFQENVGAHTDYDDAGQRPLGSLQPEEKWPRFYQEYRNRMPRDFSGNEVVGWFQL